MYWWQQQAFGANPFYFHLVSLAIHLINTFLVYKLVARVTKNKSVGYISSFLYATSAIHFISLFWLAETNLLLGALLLFLNLNLYLSGRFIVSLILFALGLLTHEIIIIFPVLAFLFRRPPKVYFFILAGLSITYLSLRLFILPIPATGTYTLHFNLGSNFRSLAWYFLWAFNLPEELKYQTSIFPPSIQPKFLTSFPTYLIIWIIGLITFLLISLKRMTFTSLAWFIIGISLFLILPLHQYPMYALIALPGITLLLARGFLGQSPFVRGLIIAFWLATSFITLRFSEMTHWAIQEASRVQRTFTRVKALYPDLPPDSTVIVNQDYQIQQALFYELGLRFLYQDQTLHTSYGRLDTLAPPECKILLDSHQPYFDCLAKYKLYYLYF